MGASSLALRSFDAAFIAALRANLALFARMPSTSSMELRRAAVALALVPSPDGTAAFMLTRRATGLRSHGGQWALPGGRIDAGEGIAVAALRELHEELGIVAEESAVLGLLDDYATRSGYLITPVVVSCATAGEPVPNPREVASVHRIPLSELERPDAPRLTPSRKGPHPILSMPLMGTYVHAPTAAILYQFREVALHGRATRVGHFDQPEFAWS